MFKSKKIEADSVDITPTREFLRDQQLTDLTTIIDQQNDTSVIDLLGVNEKEIKIKGR